MSISDYSTVNTHNILRKSLRRGRPMAVMGQAGVVILGKRMGCGGEHDLGGKTTQRDPSEGGVNRPMAVTT